MSLEELRHLPAAGYCPNWADQLPAKQFRAVVRLLESKDSWTKLRSLSLSPWWANQLKIDGSYLALNVLPEILQAGQSVQLNVNASLKTGELNQPRRRTTRNRSDPATPIRTLEASGNLTIRNERHGILSLGSATPGTDQAPAEMYWLIFQPTILTPDMRHHDLSAAEDDDQVAKLVDRTPGA